MIRDYSSIYNIEDFIVNDVAPIYFPNLDSVSMSNVGLFGMITHTSGSVIEDSFNITARYLNESILSRATLPDFIYAFAASYGVNDIFGNPAKMPFFLIIKESDILTYSTPIGQHREFRIDADLKIFIDSNDLIFSIPYDIVIRSTKFRDEYSHIAVYDVNHNNSLVSKDKSPYIKMIRQKVSGEVWLVLRVDVYQYERKRYIEPIITNNILNIAFIDKTFQNKLANFELFYEAPDSSELVQLNKMMDTSTATIEPFVYYKMLDDNTIRFSFANDDRYFIPAFNSKVHIYIYETQGTLGNFDWKVEDLKANLVPDTEDESIAYNRNIFTDGQIIGKSQGGSDQLTLEEIKAITLEKQITIDSYTTERDLNLHFLNTMPIKGIKAIFVKHRDDLAGREYGCFTRIGDGTDIYPTNTLDLKIQTSQCDDRFDNLHQFILKPGARLVYENDKTLNTLKVIHENDPIKYDIEYRTLNLMVIGLKSNNVRSYMNSLDNDIQVNYDYMNDDSPFNFMVGNCHIYRNALRGDSEYKVSISVARVDGIAQADTGIVENVFIMDPERIKVLMIFDTTIGHYIEMNMVGCDQEESMFEFEGTVATNDMITAPKSANSDEDCKISITNLITRKTGLTDSRTVDIMNPGITFAVFYDYGDDLPKMGHEYSDIYIVENHALCNTYTPLEDSFYFAYPMSLMRSHVIFQDEPTSEDGYSFLIKQVPVVGKYFLDTDKGASTIFNAIIDHHRLLQEVIPSMTEAFTIIMKFYNTYGRARLFQIVDSTGKEHSLNYVNCTIRLKVKFFEGVNVEDYIPEVQKFTKKYLESINDLDSGLNDFHISVLLQRLHDEYEQIDYMLFDSINGYDSSHQTILSHEKINESTAPTVIPEYLTMYASDVTVTPL